MTTTTTLETVPHPATHAAHAALVLRLAMGALFVAHALIKIFVMTPAGVAGYFGSLGLPAALAYLTIAAELLGGLALIAGFRTRLVSLALLPILLGATVLGHGGNGFSFSNAGCGWEYPLFWSIALIVQALLGGGTAALTRD